MDWTEETKVGSDETEGRYHSRMKSRVIRSRRRESSVRTQGGRRDDTGEERRKVEVLR